MEASRSLNDAISRMPADAPAAERIELLLVAGLADSNLRFFDSAEDYFARADALLAANPNLPGGEVLVRKRRSYGALDLLNRRNFDNAIAALDKLASGPMDPSQPLTDPTTIRMMNQAGGGNARNGVIATPDVAALSQLVVDAQANWARSVALLAQGKPAESLAALQQADSYIAVLKAEPVDQQQVAWLVSRVERQRARLLARENQFVPALASLDLAVSSLEGANTEASTFGPTLAETRLERAAMASRAGAAQGQVMAEFDKAIESLIASNAVGFDPAARARAISRPAGGGIARRTRRPNRPKSSSARSSRSVIRRWRVSSSSSSRWSPRAARSPPRSRTARNWSARSPSCGSRSPPRRTIRRRPSPTLDRQREVLESRLVDDRRRAAVERRVPRGRRFAGDRRRGARRAAAGRGVLQGRPRCATTRSAS